MKKFFCVSLVAALSLLLFSCSNFFSSSSSDNESAPNGKARVHFSLGKTDARTIMPEIYTEEDISLVELTAQKISEGEATVYKLDGENEKLSLTSLAALENVSIDIDYGTYTFVLNLSIEDEEENKTVLVQTCTLENQEINADTKELVFNMEEDSGDVKITVSWNLLEDSTDPCRIKKIESEFYTLDSFGKDLANGIEKQAFGITINDEEFLKIASASYTEVPNGSYIIKLFLYNSATATEPFDTITDIIKVNGYKTLYKLNLDPSKLNVQYEVVFDPNGGKWGDGSTEPKTVLRNAYSGFIPPEDDIKHSTDDGLGLVGWYSFPHDSLPVNQDTSGGTSNEEIKREDYAQDYKFFAIWGKKTSGNLIKDNQALIIKTDIVDGKIYQNSKINLSVTDSNGNEVDDSEEIHYTTQILYKGKDINGLTVEDHPYYHAEEKEIFLRGLENPIPKEKYQLYVTASRDRGGSLITSSQTFDVELVEGLATPETQVALFKKSQYINEYTYYLTDSNSIGTLGTQTVSSNDNNIIFDASGNYYIFNDSTNIVRSNNTVISSSGIDLEELPDDTYDRYNNGFVIDLANNIAYGYHQYENTISLYKYPNLLSQGVTTSSNSINLASVTLANVSDWMDFKRLVIGNNIVYAIIGNYLVSFDISSGTPEKLAEFNLSDYISNTLTFSDSASVKDIFAMEGAVYLIVSDMTSINDVVAWTTSNKDIIRRGTVIKYVPPKAEGENTTVNYLEAKGKAYANDDISNMYLYKDSGGSSWIYKDNEGKTLKYAEGNKRSQENDSGDLCNTFFPNVYAVSNLTENYLSAPLKVIAIKPKKLIIADDGVAFYTDNEGCLRFKNINRVVTIDLENFVRKSMHIEDTAAEFDSEYADHLVSEESLKVLVNYGTYYDFKSSVWYFNGSDNEFKSYDLSYANSGNIKLGIKEDK